MSRNPRERSRLLLYASPQAPFSNFNRYDRNGCLKL